MKLRASFFILVLFLPVMLPYIVLSGAEEARYDSRTRSL